MLKKAFSGARDEHGSALILVVLLTVILATLGTVLIDVVQADEGRAIAGVQNDAALQAAEAGIDNYVSKLVDDNQYYLHDVAAGESTRKAGANPTVAGSCSGTPAPATWTYGLTWAYPNGKDQWCPLGNGYEYNLQVTGTSASSQIVDIIATGRKTGTTKGYRILEEQIRPSSVADFQMLANADISYGSTATTNGKVYAGVDSNGVKHSIDHNGTAYGNLYAEGNITGNPTMAGSPVAQQYTSANIRTVIKQPIQFSNFTTSLSDISRAASLSGISLDNSAAAWQLTFVSNGTVQIAKCSLTSGNADDVTQPTCAAPTTYPVPANGAIYSQADVVINGGTSTCGSPAITGSCVNGRVTVASAQDIIIGDDIDYVQTGDDVLGLIAGNEMIVAKWCPNNLNWRAATIAQTGAWHSSSSSQSKGTMVFTGSTATNQGGYMSMFATRVYNYDSELSYLQPPWFPTIDFAYTVLLFRELPAP
jgi:Tfp pilus assembly protein PilX